MKRVLPQERDLPEPLSTASLPKEKGKCSIFITVILGINLVGLLLVSLWFRCRLLENIPGINGDEAWYGVQCVDMLNGTDAAWKTPTGNPLNPFFIGPMLLLHKCFAPSFTLLRSVAVASGIIALLINWAFCRWIFDKQMAWISTAVLALLTTDIAYSRFPWAASQSLAATPPVIYLSLAAVKFPQLNVRLLAIAFIFPFTAVLVLP